MTSTFNIEESNGVLKIIIKPNPSFILRFGVWFFYAIPFSFIISGVIYLVLTTNKPLTDLRTIGGFIMCILVTLFVFRFMKKLYESEIITITDTYLTLAARFLYTKKPREFLLREITDLKVLGRE